MSILAILTAFFLAQAVRLNMSQPETRRLIIQPFTSNDLDFLHSIWTEPLVRRYLFDDLVIRREQAQAIIEASQESFVTSGYGFWRIALKEGEKNIVFCGLRNFNNEYVAGEQIEILYGLTVAQCGKGLATEAAHAGLRYGFEWVCVLITEQR